MAGLLILSTAFILTDLVANGDQNNTPCWRVLMCVCGGVVREPRVSYGAMLTLLSQM